mgnify:CR=1 FL=1
MMTHMVNHSHVAAAATVHEMSFGTFEFEVAGVRTGHHKKFMELDTDGNLKLSKHELSTFLKEL